MKRERERERYVYRERCGGREGGVYGINFVPWGQTVNQLSYSNIPAILLFARAKEIVTCTKNLASNVNNKNDSICK